MGCAPASRPVPVRGDEPSLQKAAGLARTWKLDDFSLAQVIGDGTFSRVRIGKVKDDEDDRTLVVKILTKLDLIKLQQVDHVKAEKQILLMINHPFIVDLLGTFHDEKHLYMMMEYVNGGELHSYIQKQQGEMTSEASQFFGGEIVLALAYLHSLKIAHRDLKPSNLLLDCEGHIKLADFGFAKIIENLSHTLVGTPDYCAPEIIKKEGHGRAVDWWAFGVVMYELLAAYTPFEADDMEAVFGRVTAVQAGTDIEFPKKFDPKCKDLIVKMLEPKSAKRMQTVGDIAKHKFFKGVDWEQLRIRKVKPPYLPPVKGQDDTSMFDRYPERESGVNQISEEEQQMFNRFSTRVSGNAMRVSVKQKIFPEEEMMISENAEEKSGLGKF